MLASVADAPSYTIDGTADGSVLARYELFAAAATEPLIEVDNDLGFDSDSFLKNVLSQTKTDGAA